MVNCVDPSGSLASTSTFCKAPGISLPNVTPGYSGIGTFGNSVSGTIAFLAGGYSLQQEVTITLQPGSYMNFGTTQILELTDVPVPEPSSTTLLGATTLGLIAFMALHRNKVASRS
jgi:hypothetical protein